MIRQMDADLRARLTVLVIISALSAVPLAACGQPPPSASPTPAQTAATVLPSATPTSASPSPVPTSIGPVIAPITLTIWGPEGFAPDEAEPGGEVLRAQYQAFAEENPDINVEYIKKAPYGEAGMQRFLLLANYTAPGVLPDVAIVDAVELGPLLQSRLAQPLQELIPVALIADLFPFAREACTFDGDLIALQFEAEIEHLIYYTRGLTAPPARWDALLASSITYIFPAAGENGLVNDAFLIQYLSQGGQLVDADGRPALDESAVREVLRLYEAGIDDEVVSPRVLELADLEDCWEAYVEGNIAASHISSWRYLSSMDVLESTSFAPLPTASGRPATMSRGWAFVIITPDPERQQAAASLIQWLMTPQNLADWSREADHLPTRRSALRLVGRPQAYTTFLEIQLENALYRPSVPEFERIAQALQVAVASVLRGERTPRDAASQAVSSLE